LSDQAPHAGLGTAPDGTSQTRSPGPPGTAPAPARLGAVDVVRVLTVALVIAVHVTSQQPGGITLSSGALLIVAHVSREVFFLLTAFVLTYSYRDRAPSRWPVFWRRRYLLIGLPYLLWSAVYFVADGEPLRSAGHVLARFSTVLLTGTARYHLYFLLVTMQMYLVFPLLRRLLLATRGRHARLLAGAAVYQVGVYAAVQPGWTLGRLPDGLGDPSMYLPSYLGFVVAGGVAAVHAETLMRWTGARTRWVCAGCAIVVAAGVAAYFVRVGPLGQAPGTPAPCSSPSSWWRASASPGPSWRWASPGSGGTPRAGAWCARPRTPRSGCTWPTRCCCRVCSR